LIKLRSERRNTLLPSRWLAFAVALALIAGASTGCSSLLYRLKTPAPRQVVPNPLTLPPAEDLFVWF